MVGGAVVRPRARRDVGAGRRPLRRRAGPHGLLGDGRLDTVVMRRRDTPLRGIDIDMSDISDLVPTLAVVATQAVTPTRITGVGFIREKESDRLGDLAGELRKTGADIDWSTTTGSLIRPTDLLHGARLDTHHDHRLAMAFGVLGLVVDGIEVADPTGRLQELARLLGRARRRSRRLARDRPDVAAFDFDGTLTDRDCVVPFLRRVAGTPTIALGLGQTPAARRFRRSRGATVITSRRRRREPRSRCRRARSVDADASAFADRDPPRRIRPDAAAPIAWHRRGRCTVIVIVSASFELYVRPLGGAARCRRRARDPARASPATARPVHGRPRRAELSRTREGPPAARLARRASRRRARASSWSPTATSPGDREMLADADHAHLGRAR